jgi:lipoprotein-releasing system ATP-binding protein
MNTKPILKAEHIFKSYLMGNTELEVLKDICLEIQEGEIVAVIGASGVGKSTLLHILGCLDRPTTGQVHINDIDAFSFRETELANFRNQEIGFVFQFHHLLPEFTALENVMMPGLIARQNETEVRKRAEKLLDEVELSARYHHRPSELSGGEQQRVAVARSLINSPHLLLADEPSGNLDRVASQSLHRLLWDLNNHYNQTLIIVTHNLEIAQKADRIVELFDGQLKQNNFIG